MTVNNVEKYLKKAIENAVDHVFCFQARSLIGERDEEIIRKLFSPHELEKNYEKFIIKADLTLKSRNYKLARSLVEEFPKIILEDRGVPGEFYENPEIRQDLYQKAKKSIN